MRTAVVFIAILIATVYTVQSELSIGPETLGSMKGLSGIALVAAIFLDWFAIWVKRDNNRH